MTKAELEKWLKAQLAAIKLRLKAVEALEQLATDSVKASDQADLDDAKKRSQRPSALPTQKEVDDNFRKFGQGDAALKKIVDEWTDINKKTEASKVRIQKMTIPATPQGMSKADLEKLLKAQLAAAKLHLKAVETLEQLARDAVRAGDQGDLTAAIGGSKRPRPSGMLTQQQIDARFAQAGQGDAALKKIVNELADINKKTEAIKLRIQNMAIPATPPTAPQGMSKADLEKLLKAQLAAAKLHLKAVETLEQLAEDSVRAGDQGDLYGRNRWEQTTATIGDADAAAD